MESRIRVVAGVPTHSAAKGALALNSATNDVYKQTATPSGNTWAMIASGGGAGGMPTPIRKTIDYTLAPTDYSVLFDTGLNPLVATLPAAPANNQRYELMNSGITNNILTVDGNGKNIGSSPTIVVDSKSAIALVFNTTEDRWDITSFDRTLVVLENLGNPNGVTSGSRGWLYRNTSVGEQYWMNVDGATKWRLLLPHGEELREQFFQTNDASANTLDTIPVPVDTIVFIEATVIAQDEVSVTREAAIFKINKAFKLVSGVAAPIGLEDRFDINEITGLLCYFTVTGTDILLIINGHASDQVGWHSVLKITYSRAIPGGV